MAYAIDPTGQARKARTLTATDPATGQTVTRRTDRVYVAAVVYTSSNGKVYAAAWAGRPDLAAKALEKRGVGSENGYRLAPVTSDPWATPEPEPVAAAPEPVAAEPEPVATPDPLTAAAADLVAAVTAAPVAPAPLNPAGGLILMEFRSATPGRPYLAGDGVTLWAFETEALARAAAGLIAATGATPYLAGPGPQGRPEPLAPEPAPQPVAPATPEPCRPLLPGEPPAAAPVAAAGPEPTLPPLDRVALDAVARLGFRTLNPATEGLTQAPADCYPPAQAARAAALALETAAPPAGAGVAAHRAAAAAGRPVSLAALPPVTTAQAEALAYCRAALRGVTAAV